MTSFPEFWEEMRACPDCMTKRIVTALYHEQGEEAVDSFRARQTARHNTKLDLTDSEHEIVRRVLQSYQVGQNRRTFLRRSLTGVGIAGTAYGVARAGRMGFAEMVGCIAAAVGAPATALGVGGYEIYAMHREEKIDEWRRSLQETKSRPNDAEALIIHCEPILWFMREAMRPERAIAGSRHSPAEDGEHDTPQDGASRQR